VLAPDPLVLALVILVFGYVNSTMDVSMNAHGVALETAAGTSIFSRLHAGWSIGGTIGAVGVAVTLAIGVDPLLQVALAGLAFWVLAALAGTSLGTGSRRATATGIHWPSRAVLPIAVLLGLVAFVEGAAGDWGGVYLRATVSASPEVAALAFGALSVGLTAGRLGGDTVKDRFGSIRMIQLGMLLTAATIAIVLVVGDPLITLAGLMVAGIGLANAVPQLLGAAGRIRPHGPSLSAAFTFFTLAFLVGPPIIGTTADAIGMTLALGLTVIASVVVAAAIPRVSGAETNPRFASTATTRAGAAVDRG
jgi:hypothetical protein